MATWNWNDYIKPGKEGLLALAKQYADAGMMARAKDAFERAGGKWTNEVHRQFKSEAAATTRYGGDIQFKWTDYGVRTQAQLDQIIEWAKAGDFSKIRTKLNSLGGEKKWNATLHKKLSAEYVGMQPKDTEEVSTEFKRDEPTVAPTLYDTTTTEVVDEVETVVPDWRTQFKGKITKGQVGAWGLDDSGKPVASQARKDAQKWRDLHMGAAKKKWGYGTDEFNKQAYIDQRNKIATRHRKMLGAGPKTLKTGEVLSY